MKRTITASDADRDFPGILREVHGGTTFIVTHHGRPVARIVPYDSPQPVKTGKRKAAHAALLEHLRDQPVTDIGPWTRDELYDD